MLQTKAQAAIVECVEAVRRLEQGFAEFVACGPSAQAGDHVARQHRFAVMKAQARAQGQGPKAAVILGEITFQHLRARTILAVHAVERVEHRVAMGTRLGGGVDHRIEDRKVDIGNEAQCPPSGGGDAWGGERGGSREELTTFHSPV